MNHECLTMIYGLKERERKRDFPLPFSPSENIILHIFFGVLSIGQVREVVRFLFANPYFRVTFKAVSKGY